MLMHKKAAQIKSTMSLKIGTVSFYLRVFFPNELVCKESPGRLFPVAIYQRIETNGFTFYRNFKVNQTIAFI